MRRPDLLFKPKSFRPGPAFDYILVVKVSQLSDNRRMLLGIEATRYVNWRTHAHVALTSVLRRLPSFKPVEQSPCLLKIRSIEALSEPVINWREQSSGLIASAPSLQHSTEAHRRS